MNQKPEQIQPVFIIGSYRSATSALTWALGQHPNLFPLEETHFLYKLAVDLENLYELGTAQGEHSFLGLARYAPTDFRSYFGEACNRMVQDARDRIVHHCGEIRLRDRSLDNPNIKLRHDWAQPKQRWVDGTPENSHFVLPLLNLFPGARFIHILRNPRRVATSLMHFSTMGAHDYDEESAYRAWVHLVRDAALSEQALGPERVMRLMHEDLVASPGEALARCLAFIGEKYHTDCLMPLREKINSSRYDDPGDCSIEANIDSDKPWVREAFELYATLVEGNEVIEGGIPAARKRLVDNLHEYRTSLLPATNSGLSKNNQLLNARITELERQYAILLRRVNPTEQALEVLDWGPRDIQAGVPFNQQPDGNSAIWVSTRHASPDTQIILGGLPLETTVHSGGDLVTALVPADLTSSPCKLEMRLRSRACDVITGAISIAVKAMPAR